MVKVATGLWLNTGVRTKLRTASQNQPVIFSLFATFLLVFGNVYAIICKIVVITRIDKLKMNIVYFRYDGTSSVYMIYYQFLL